MKDKIKILFISLLGALLMLSGCDFLDIEPHGELDDKAVWSSKIQVDKIMASMYSAMDVLNLHQDEPWVGLSDECDLAWAVYSTFSKNLGNWSEYDTFGDKYERKYQAIRQTLELEQNIHRCTEIGAIEQRNYIAEARFLRAYYYWQLLRQYGPIVLMDDVYSYNSDFSQFMRSPYDECVDHIVDLLKQAEEGFYDDFPSATDIARPRKITCKALKSIVLHHAASPQFNGGYAKYANFKNPDGVQLISTTYDENKWKKAAAAAKEVITMAEESPNSLGLYSNANDIHSPQHNPYLSYQEALLSAWNKEIIWGRSLSNGTQAWIIHAHPSPTNLGGVAPTQRLVDAFLMSNGKPIEDPNSGYVENGWATEAHPNWNPNKRNITTQTGKEGIITDSRNGTAYGHWVGHWNMYANREPRFYASVLYNMRMILPLPTDAARRNVYSSNNNQDGLGRVEFYYGGKSRPTGNDSYPKSGYLTMKKVDPTCEQGVGSERKYPRVYTDVHIRYAQILLNYIESLNEYDPQNPDIKTYWDLIRTRAGVPGAFEASPEIKGNKDLQREFIIRERLIELNMEGDRYFTTRRRLLADKVDTNSKPGYEKFGDGGPMYGMDVNTGSTAGNSFSFEGFYQRVPFETRVFREEFYLFPIPGKQVDISQGKIVQNPGWRK